jgi:hypothetical protein
MTTSPLQPLVKAGLIALMAFLSIMLWLGIPIGWLWIGSQLQSGTQATGFGPYFLVLGGIAVSVVIVTKLLAALNRTYARVDGKADEIVRVRMPWHRSMRGDDDSRPPRNVLDVVMVISVSLAVLAMTIWFFFFAGSSLPT